MFHINLKNLRLTRGLSQKQIADYLNRYNAQNAKPYGGQLGLKLNGADPSIAFTYKVVITSDTGVEFTSTGYTK